MYSIGNRAIAVVLALVISTAITAQPTRPSVKQLTVVERTKEGFYGAIADAGPAVTATWNLSAKSVERGQPLTLTLIVRNAANPEELLVPKLRGKVEFDAVFTSIDDGIATLPAPGIVEIVYKVTPRNEGQHAVPELSYYFYRPGLPANKRFQLSRAEAIQFDVTAPIAVVAPPVPLDAPESFFALPTSIPLNASTAGPSALAWFILWIALPVIIVAWILGWRRLYPDSARLAKIRRNRAVRVALDKLRQANATADPAATVAHVLLGYLCSRHGLPASAQTPVDVADALRILGWQEGRISEAEALLRDCDEARFSEVSRSASESYPEIATRLIETWEGAQGWIPEPKRQVPT